MESSVIASAVNSANSVKCILSTAVLDPGSSYTNGIDTGYLILYETNGIIATDGTSSSDVSSMLECSSSIVFSEDYVKDSQAASGEELESVTAQLSRNRAIMDNLQSQWLSYVNE